MNSAISRRLSVWLSKSVDFSLGGVAPSAFVEPTCGLGSFALAALDQFPFASGIGVEIKPAYIKKLRTSLKFRKAANKLKVIQRSFFDVAWNTMFRGILEPILVLGNPPWVTNSRLGVLGSGNLPTKSNFQKHAGLDAITGKSNFDISEWMLIKLLESLRGRRAWLAMLCKTAVRERPCGTPGRNGIGLDRAEIPSN